MATVRHLQSERNLMNSKAPPQLGVIVTSLAALVVLPSNCGGSSGAACDPATENLKCDGNKVLVCACTKPFAKDSLAGGPLCHSDGFTWIDGQVCSVACNVTVAPQTGCIASGQPVPECSKDGPACWNGNITYCQNGYPLQTTPCSSGTQCAPIAGCGALCLDSSAIVDPRCPATTGTSGFCEDNTAYFCGCGYLIGSTVCGSPPNACTLMGGDYPVCGLPP